MKEPNLGLMAYNLLNAVTALSSILDQPGESNLISVNYTFVARLICDAQVTAKEAADELMRLHEEEKWKRDELL